MRVPDRVGHSSARCLVTWSGGSSADGQQCAQVFFLGADQLAALYGAAREDDLLVQPGAFRAGHDYADVADDGRDAQHVRGDDAGGDPVQPRLLGLAGGGPELGAEQAQAHLYQRMPKVEQDDIGALGGGVAIERDRQFPVGNLVVEAVVPGRGPGAGQFGDAEAQCGEARRARNVAQVSAEGELKRGADDVLDGLWGEVEVAPALDQGVGELLQISGEVTDDPELGAAEPGPALDLEVDGLPVLALTKHLLLDLGGDDIPGAAQVLPDLLGLSRRDPEEVQFVLERAVVPAGVAIFPALGDEVVDVDLGGWLAEAVDATVALL